MASVPGGDNHVGITVQMACDRRSVNTHSEKYAHKSRKKEQVINHRTEVRYYFPQRIGFHANPMNLSAGRRRTPFASFSDNG
jgi:hypothetical protein